MTNPHRIRISITLSPTQVDAVVRAATSSRAPGMSALIGGFPPIDDSDPRLSRSLLLGLLVLGAFPTDGEALAVSDIAARLGLSPSTTHRYMSTLLAVGLLEQDPRSRRYRVPLNA